MSNTRKEKLKQLLRPANIPKSSQSTKVINRNVKSIDFSNSESRNSTQSTLSKSVCKILVKNLEELSSNFEDLKKKSRDYGKDLFELVVMCETSLNHAKQKVSEMSLDEDLFKFSDSKTSLDTLNKSENSEQSLFLDYLLSYEQMKSEIILKKSKFPKSRIAEVEKSLLEEFSMKNPKFFRVAKAGDVWNPQKAQNEFKDLVNKIKKKMMSSVRVLPDLENLLDESLAEPFTFISCETSEPKSFTANSKALSKAQKKLQDLYDSSLAENKKLSAKYNYLISKLNKQETTVRRQAKILGNISKDSRILKETFEEFVCEMKFYISMLQDNILKSPGKKIQITSNLKEKVAWDSEKEKMKKEIELCRKEKNELEHKLQSALKELIQLKEQEEISEDSLDLGRNNINDIIEIQKLKEHIRLLNFRSSEQYTNYMKEIDSYKSKITKLRADKFSYEERYKALNMHISDLQAENDRLLEEITKNKTSQEAFQQFKPIPMLCGDTFNVEEPSESFGKVNPADILAMVTDEVEEIIENLKAHNVFPNFHSNRIGLLKKIAEFVIGLKENLYEESEFFEHIVEDLVEDYKNRKSSGDKAFEIEKRLDTESFISDKQLELYKTKLKDKRNQLELCYKQISYLKKSLKESKEEASKTNTIDLECIKGMFGNILKEVSQLSQKTENLIEVMMKNLGFSQEEINKINSERRSKKSSWFSKGIF